MTLVENHLQSFVNEGLVNKIEIFYKPLDVNTLKILKSLFNKNNMLFIFATAVFIKYSV